MRAQPTRPPPARARPRAAAILERAEHRSRPGACQSCWPAAPPSEGTAPWAGPMCVRPAPGRPGYASASALASTRACEEPPRPPARGAGECGCPPAAPSAWRGEGGPPPSALGLSVISPICPRPCLCLSSTVSWRPYRSAPRSVSNSVSIPCLGSFPSEPCQSVPVSSPVSVPVSQCSCQHPITVPVSLCPVSAPVSTPSLLLSVCVLSLPVVIPVSQCPVSQCSC